MSIIDYRNVEIHQEEMFVLGDVSFSVGEGDFIYLVGKVGSGKSTLFKTLYGELDVICNTPDSRALIFGMDMSKIKRRQIPDLRRKMGIVFQDFQLLTDRSVQDNLAFVLKSTGWKNKLLIMERISKVLEMVGMETKGYKMPHELSGGEQQRICIARALLNEPKLILADEPTANLDQETGKAIMEILHKVRQGGTTVMMITHNQQWLKDFPGKVFRCEDRRLIVETSENSENSEN